MVQFFNKELMKKLVFSLLLASLFSFLNSCREPQQTPSAQTGFAEVTSYKSLKNFCREAAKASEHLEMEVFGQSVEGRDLLVMKAGNSNATQQEKEKLRVLLFAQQHGNEQSGKEAALLLVRDIANGHYQDWFDQMELWIVPQVNPDGGEINQRRNALDIDLNRDHVVQQAPETRALHELFHRFLPHVTIDVHEYQPYRQSWESFGAFKDFDVQVGVNTNPNIDEAIRDFSLEKALPFLENHLAEEGYSFHNYLVGPVPAEGRTRHSTVDIDDGRQGFGIMNTMAFIFEGKNGRDGFVENLERRSLSQAHAMAGLMDFLFQHQSAIISMVNQGRENLRKGRTGEMTAIRMEHFPGNEPLELSLVSAVTGQDTLVLVEDYHPVVKPTFFVANPKGYLLPVEDTLLMRWMDVHRLESENKTPSGTTVYSYRLLEINRRVDEELENYFPVVEKSIVDISDREDQYIFVPISQLKGNFLVLTLEPQSQIGLVQYPMFSYLLHEDGVFPVLRVE